MIALVLAPSLSQGVQVVTFGRLHGPVETPTLTPPLGQWVPVVAPFWFLSRARFEAFFRVVSFGFHYERK